MADFSGATIGERVALYRRLNRQTMDELAAETGGVVKRDVIANIESGRRKDVTVSQLIALSNALGVPPTALIFDVARPMEEVDGPRMISEDQRPRLHELMNWYALLSPVLVNREKPAAELVNEQVSAWRDVLVSQHFLRNLVRQYETLEAMTSEGNPAKRGEIGIKIERAWRDYRRAVSAGVEGLAEPSIPEEFAREFVGPEYPAGSFEGFGFYTDGPRG